MYSSGRWNGHWDQPGFGRQPMQEFSLRFADGTCSGEGRDLVGTFVVRGIYDAHGSVEFVKQYVGKHQVRYVGRHDGEGTIHGEWSISPAWAGSFALKPVHRLPVDDWPIQAIE